MSYLVNSRGSVLHGQVKYIGLDMELTPWSRQAH